MDKFCCLVLFLLIAPFFTAASVTAGEGAQTSDGEVHKFERLVDVGLLYLVAETEFGHGLR